MASGGPDLVLTRDAGDFGGRVGHFLAQRPERNVAATVLASVRSGRYADSRPLFAYGRAADGTVNLAVLRTPPWPLLASDLDPALADGLLERWLASDPDLPGVSGTLAAARAVSDAWCRRSGGQSRCRMQMALHSLDTVVDPPRPASGSLRLPRQGERALLLDWHRAFERDAGVAVSDEPGALIDERLGHDGWLVWDDHGPVSLVGVNRPVAGTVRLGPVYTPPELRNRGYASAAVAAASRRALTQGATRCILFTDLANPTSNGIYGQVGYRRIAEWEEHSFQPAAGA
jgi:RimJ/RimL family protein N-acetyltransferase